MKPSEDLEKQVKKVRDLIRKEKEKAKKKGHVFTELDENEIRSKLTRVHTPFINFQSWSSSAPAGGTISYTVGIFNPDPITQSSMFVHLFIGPANPVPDVGAALAQVDDRFPRLSEPQFFGLSLAPSTGSSLSFQVNVPSVEPSNYLGNSFLFRADWHDVGDYLDRSIFVFQVT